MEGIFPSPAEAETEEEMFTMPTIDMVATGRNIMRLREVAGLCIRDSCKRPAGYLWICDSSGHLQVAARNCHAYNR